MRIQAHNKRFSHWHPSNPAAPVKLSSAGLVFAHYGRDIVRAIIQNAIERKNYLGSEYGDFKLNNALRDIEDEGRLIALAQKIYSNFIEEIDGIDNGRDMADGGDVPYNHHISTNLNSRVARLNPRSGRVTDEIRFKSFLKAMN
ncbi:hypothetical protein GZH46_01229, partial [Fragariocoptes setiger]